MKYSEHKDTTAFTSTVKKRK